MQGKHQKTISSQFRNGQLEILDICDKFNEFSGLLTNFYHKFGASKGKSDLSAIITIPYISAFYKFYEEFPKRFDRLLKQCLIMSLVLPFCARLAQAQKVLEKVYCWRPQQIKSDWNDSDVKE
jgi:hypothetical protein